MYSGICSLCTEVFYQETRVMGQCLLFPNFYILPLPTKQLFEFQKMTGKICQQQKHLVGRSTMYFNYLGRKLRHFANFYFYTISKQIHKNTEL